MERKMLCEAAARVARIAPLRQYRYVGLGGLTFQDFALFHQRLGMRDMISIERREEQRRRFEFNKPYSCIQVEWGDAHDVLPLLDWRKRAIVWLDYEGHPTGQVLQDISLVVSKLRSGSLLIITVPADPGEDAADPSAPKKRLQKLKDRVGKTRVPVGVKAEHLAKWGTAKIYRRIITDDIGTTVSDRNAALAKDERVSYRQLFNFHYQDGSKMLTIGGLILNRADARFIGPTSFADLRYIRTADDEYRIRFPILTSKETRHLDTRLPFGSLNRSPAWLPEEDRLSYKDVYRYFPTYVEAEM
jgi:hypothetical protein